MTTPANALVLDFGGVISRTLFETHATTETALGLPPGSLTWRGPFDPDNDPLWRSMQADEITERDYWRIRGGEVGQLIGETWSSMVEFVQAARGDAPSEIIRPEALATIETVKKAGRPLAILSNELDLFYGATFRHKLPFLNEFDVIVDATHTGILKPDPEAYNICLRELGLEAAACILVDDQMRNIDGATAAGLKTCWFDVAAPKQSYARALAAMGLEYPEAS